MSSNEDELFSTIDDDPESAFLALEAHFRSELEEALDRSGSNDTSDYYKTKYIAKVKAISEELQISGLEGFAVPESENNIWKVYESFSNSVLIITTRLKIRKSRRKREFSVAFDASQKAKVRFYISKIRELVDSASISIEKKEAIFKKISNLEWEIDADRTTLARVTDTVRALARLSGDVEREGAEPWWKWVMAIFGVIDEAKEKEPVPQLPSPPKRLESPKKDVGHEKKASEEDGDDIPF